MTPRRLYLLAAIVFWSILLCYLLAVPQLRQKVAKGDADFSQFYTAGKILQLGQGRRLYDLDFQYSVQTGFSAAAVSHGRALPYPRPPFEALLFLPFSYLSYQHAYAIWLAFSALLVGVTAVFLRSRIADLRDIPWWLYYPSYLAFFPIASGFILGQDFALMLFFYALVFVFWIEGQDVVAGCFLGLALIKFQLVLPLILILLLKKQFRTLAAFALVAVTLVLVSIGVVGWEGVSGYPAYMWKFNEIGAGSGIYPSRMPSIRGLVQGWPGFQHGYHFLNALTLAISLTALVWAAWQWRTLAPRSSKTYSAGVSVAIVATMLAGYHEYIYDLSLLFPVVVRAGYVSLFDGELDFLTRWILVFAVTALLLPPVYLWLIGIGYVNLMGVAVLFLAWGMARASRAWTVPVDNAVVLSDAIGN